MSIQLSPVIIPKAPGHGPAGRPQGAGLNIPPHVRANLGVLSVQMLDFHEQVELASPVVFLFHSRQRGGDFAPHPHAGCSAVSYVFEDSQTGLRTRDSLGNDFVIDPGGIAWSQAANGVIHEELPAQADRELHGVQIFVNLSSKNKLVSPQVFHFSASEVPEWRSDAGDGVRVVVGSFEGVSSPLVPAEPFTLLDVALRREIAFHLPTAHNALVYLLIGTVLIRAEGHEQEVAGGQALALHGIDNGGRVTISAVQPAHFLILSGAEIREPVLMNGNFMMTEQTQIEAAIARYRAGDMGHLAPLSDLEHEEQSHNRGT